MALTAACPAAASWTVEVRPIDQAPNSLEVRPLVSLHVDGLSHVDWQGVDLKEGPNALFDVTLPRREAPRVLELQLAYVTTSPTFSRAATCPVTLVVEAQGEQRVARELSLRSIHPAVEPFEALAARYDYLAPELSVELPRDVTRVAASVSVGAACRDGRVLAVEPKVWLKRDDAPAKRFVFIASDSLSADWFGRPDTYAPATTAFFAQPGARLSTRVISVGSNTNDTTNILGAMRYEMRGADRLVREPAPEVGLVPAFLAAGYEVLSFNSNLYLSTAFQPAGFRSLINLNADATPNNVRSPEITTGMMLDWLTRHPDRDVMFFLWFDTTHYGVEVTQVRPGFSLAHLPYGGPDYSKRFIALQARALSYVDLVLERVLNRPELTGADVFFFSDHGLNFDTLEHPQPRGGTCGERLQAANHHLAPVELRIPVGMRVHGYDPGPLPHDTSLIDWVYSAVKHHNPRIDVGAWQGHELSETGSTTPALTMGHHRHASVFIGGRQFLLEDPCAASALGPVYDGSWEKSAARDDVMSVMSVLDGYGLLRFHKVSLEVFHGSGDCRVEVDMPGALNPRGGWGLRQLVDPTRWYTRLEPYVPALLDARQVGLRVHSSRAGCAELQAGYVRRSLPEEFDLAGSGLAPLTGLRGPELKVGVPAVIRVLSGSPANWVRRGDRLVAGGAATPRDSELSTEVRTAMKRWGYIQDDDGKN